MSDNTEFRKELEERTKQINEQIESYLQYLNHFNVSD